MNLLTKLIFYFKRPKIIIVSGKNRFLAIGAVLQVLEHHFKIQAVERISLKNILDNEILVLEIFTKEDLTFLIKKSKKPILINTYVGEIPQDTFSFSGTEQEIDFERKLARILPDFGSLILNFDDEAVRNIREETSGSVITFGFQKMADLTVTDLNISENTFNFKIDYQEKIIPVWLENIFEKETVYAVLASICAGIELGVNLVEISQILKDFKDISAQKRLSY